MIKNKKYIIPFIAFFCLLFAIYMMLFGIKKTPISPIEYPPPEPPYEHYISGAGMVEAASQNIEIAAPFEEIIEEIYVREGDEVKKGDPLFQLDIRSLNASLKEAQEELKVAIADYEKQLHLPRPEDIPPLEALVKANQNRYKDQRAQLEFLESVKDKRAISVSEITEQYFASKVAQYEMEEAKKNLDLLKAGAWDKDLVIYKAKVDQSEAKVKVIATDVERSTILAPIDGEVLQVNIRKGELPKKAEASILFGSTIPLHIRVDIDEEDIWRFKKGTQARAYVRGNSSISVPLEFVYVEPYVIPKKSFTGDTKEKLDTRVLQVIYSFKREDLPIYTGQIMDVFIEEEQ